MTGRVVTIVVLAVVYVLTLASLKPWDLFIGALLAILTLAIFSGLPPVGVRDSPVAGQPRTRRLFAALAFSAVVLWDIARGTWQMMLITLGRRPLGRSGLVEVPIGDRSELGVAVCGIVTTLSPGSAMVDVDWDRGVMVMHVIDASDPEAFRHDQERFYERYQRSVAP